MNRKGAWITVGIVFLGVAVFGLANLLAQRGPDRPGVPMVPPGFGIGRYQVVRSSETVIIILDTVTGDLYKANPDKDIKDYRERPRLEIRIDPGPDRDRPADRPRDGLRKDEPRKDLDKRALDKDTPDRKPADKDKSPSPNVRPMGRI